MKNRPDCILKPGMVHAKMYSTIHKSALSQQINKTLFSSRTVKAFPFIFTSETGNVMVRGRTEHTGEHKCHQQHVNGEWRGGVGWEDAGRVTAGVGKAQLQGKGVRLTDKNEKWDRDNTDHPRHRKVGKEKLGEWRRKFQNTQVGSRNWGEEQGRRRVEVGRARAGKE